jgi:hypothetical protein
MSLGELIATIIWLVVIIYFFYLLRGLVMAVERIDRHVELKVLEDERKNEP